MKRLMIFTLIFFFLGSNSCEIHVKTIHNVPISQTTPEIISVGIDMDFAPFEFLDGGNIQGFDVDIIKAIRENEGVQFQLHAEPWIKILDGMQNGTYDIMFATKTPERLLIYDFSAPIIQIQQAVFIQKSTKDFPKISDLANHTVAVVMNYSSDEYIRTNVPNAKLVLVETQAEGLRLLENNEVFAYFGHYQSVLYELKKSNIQNIKSVGNLIVVGDFCIATLKNRGSLLSFLNQSLEKLHNSGIYEEIYKRWFVTSENPQLMFQEFFNIAWPYIIGIISFFGISIFWIVLLNKKIHEKTEEIKKYFEILNQQQKFEILRVVAGGIAHDFRNCIMVISESLGLLKNSKNLTNEQIELINEINNASEKTVGLCHQMIDFSKENIPQKILADIVKVVQEAASFISRRSNVTINYEIESNIPEINIDPNQITQVIHNLVINAIQAMNQEGKIEIKISQDINPSLLKRFHQKFNKYIKIIISDHGPGISKEVQEKLFTPFFTTKKNGTGLGLVTSFAIIKRHNGFITFTTELGKGTDFIIFLPV
jgi:signal transduction histidine kinase